MTNLIQSVARLEGRIATPSPRLQAIAVAVAFAQAFIDEALAEAAGQGELSCEAVVQLDAALHQIEE